MLQFNVRASADMVTIMLKKLTLQSTKSPYQQLYLPEQKMGRGFGEGSTNSGCLSSPQSGLSSRCVLVGPCGLNKLDLLSGEENLE